MPTFLLSGTAVDLPDSLLRARDRGRRTPFSHLTSDSWTSPAGPSSPLVIDIVGAVGKAWKEQMADFVRSYFSGPNDRLTVPDGVELEDLLAVCDFLALEVDPEALLATLSGPADTGRFLRGRLHLFRAQQLELVVPMILHKMRRAVVPSAGFKFLQMLDSDQLYYINKYNERPGRYLTFGKSIPEDGRGVEHPWGRADNFFELLGEEAFRVEIARRLRALGLEADWEKVILEVTGPREQDSARVDPIFSWRWVLSVSAAAGHTEPGIEADESDEESSAGENEDDQGNQ
ncbi:hypothetical protein DFJ74DRAFT_772092 [Hyaloraphidium curvatum]|nr:hypothetical protein DFJ74DRAFT_772092 [Hyaloraphidium curvatum]